MTEFPEQKRCACVIMPVDKSGIPVGSHARRLDWASGFSISSCLKSSKKWTVTMVALGKGTAAPRIVCLCTDEGDYMQKAAEVISMLNISPVVVILPPGVSDQESDQMPPDINNIEVIFLHQV